jgi:hypothetical protein
MKKLKSINELCEDSIDCLDFLNDQKINERVLDIINNPESDKAQIERLSVRSAMVEYADANNYSYTFENFFMAVYDRLEKVEKSKTHSISPVDWMKVCNTGLIFRGYHIVIFDMGKIRTAIDDYLARGK